MAVLGSTGGGKSWSLARLVEQSAKHSSKVLLFDAAGEFSALKDGVRHVHIGTCSDADADSKEVALPFRELTERDLFAIFKPEGASQVSKLKEAIKSLKLARLEPSLAPEGTILKADKAKDRFEHASLVHVHSIETPTSDFEIYDLGRQIRCECVFPQRSSLEWEYWGGVDGSELARCVPLINRIEDIVSTPSLTPIFNSNNKPSLLNEIYEFMNDDSSQVLCVSLAELPFAHNVREIIVNAVGRHLLTLGRTSFFKTKPLLVVLDEAHQFLKYLITEGDSKYSLDSFSHIAKEGRKYALTMCLATQRPRDIPEGVLSQIGTFLVHRLANDNDRGVIERACGQLSGSALDIIPNLGSGEAVLLGASFPTPTRVKIIAPESKPDSKGPDFSKYWRRAH